MLSVAWMMIRAAVAAVAAWAVARATVMVATVRAVVKAEVTEAGRASYGVMVEAPVRGVAAEGAAWEVVTLEMPTNLRADPCKTPGPGSRLCRSTCAGR